MSKKNSKQDEGILVRPFTGLEKKVDALWQRAIEREREIENRKKATAVIYVEANYDGQACEKCLAKREACWLEYCIRKNLGVLRIFREKSESADTLSEFDKMRMYLYEHGEEVTFILDHSTEGRFVVKNNIKKAPRSASS